MPEEDDSGGANGPPASERPERVSRLGQTIAERYEVVRLLGEGGMGAVYEVRHRTVGRRFAMKFLHKDVARSRSVVARFQREAEAAGRLENENLVAAVDFGTTGDGASYLVMEYLQGEDVGALLRRVGTLPVARAVDLVMQTCRGLQVAHGHGIVHRDLKPENLFVVPGPTGTELVKILDFGIAKLTAPDGPVDQTAAGLLLGTPFYMSPEQARGDPSVDERTDIYALGVILYQLLTGEKPHPGRNATDVLFHLLRQAPVRIESLRPGLPPGLGDVIHRAFAFEVADRFPSAAALLEALGPYAHLPNAAEAGRPGSPRPSSGPELAVSTTAPQLFLPAQAGAGQSGTLRSAASASGRDPPPREGSPERAKGAPNGEARVASPELAAAEGDRRASRRRLALWAAALAAVGAAIAIVVRGPSRGPTDLPAATGARECTTNAECIRAKGGAAFVCRKEAGTCAALESEQCTVLAEPGDVEDERTFWIGAMLPLTGEKAKVAGIACMHAVDLARRDFARITHGIPAISGDGKPRPLAVVACDDATNAAAAARHLVDDVGVSAVIGFGSTQEAIDLAQSLFLPRHVLVLVAPNTSALITSIPEPRDEPRLIWRTSLSSATTGAPVSRLISDLIEPRLRAAGVVSSGSPMRVAVVRHNDTAGLSFGDVLFATVRFNGKSALENGPSYRQFVLDGDGSASFIAELAAFLPHVVLSVGFGELTTSVFAPLEDAWPHGARFRPTYLLPMDLRGEALFRFVGTSVERRRRFLGLVPPPATPANAQFTMHYNETFAEPVTLNQSPTPPYDAVYLAAYASYVAGDRLDGPSLAAGIARLVPPGKAIDVGPTRIFDVLDALRNGGQVDLNGAGNRLDYDLATGESGGDYVVQCIGIDARGEAVDGAESGLVYDAATRSLRGTLRCP